MGVWECKTLMERGVRKGEICMYFVCDLNEKRFKDSSLLWCISILLNVKGIIIDIVQVRCLLEMVFLHFF